MVRSEGRRGARGVMRDVRRRPREEMARSPVRLTEPLVSRCIWLESSVYGIPSEMNDACGENVLGGGCLVQSTSPRAESLGRQDKVRLDIPIDLVVLQACELVYGATGSDKTEIDEEEGWLSLLTSSTIWTLCSLQNCHHVSNPRGGGRLYRRLYSITACGSVFDWL